MEPCVGGSVHPARDRFCIQLYFVVFERVCADRLDATMFRFSQALVRRLPDGRLVVVIQHVLRESQGGMEGVGGIVGGWGGPAPPPRASPCGLAPLARVPLTLERRGTVGLLPA